MRHPRTRRMGEQWSAQPMQLPQGPKPGSARARPAGQTLNQRADWEFSMAVAYVAGTKAQRTPTATSCDDPEQRQRVPPTHGGGAYLLTDNGPAKPPTKGDPKNNQRAGSRAQRSNPKPAFSRSQECSWMDVLGLGAGITTRSGLCQRGQHHGWGGTGKSG